MASNKYALELENFVPMKGDPIVVELKDPEIGQSIQEAVGAEDGEDIVFILPDIPGAPDAKEIIVDEDGDDEVEIDEDEEGDDDPWNWNTKELTDFIPWLKKMIHSVPQHSGYDTTGLEKAIAFFELLDREISKAMRQDFKNEIDSAHAEKAREQIEQGLERLVERLEKVKTTKFKRHKKKKAWAEEAGFIKEAGTPIITGINITVPMIISIAARVCINGMVSAGHDIEDLYASQVKEWSLDKREQAELAQLLDDMGYRINRDRGFAVGTKVDTTKSDNRDWAAGYTGS